MKSQDQESSYRQVLQDDESLAVFMRAMAKFDRAFCDAMAAGEDYTLKLEVRGNGGRLIHARTSVDGFERPANGAAETYRDGENRTRER